MSLLGVDIGTSGCKSVVFDLRGRVLSLAYREYDVLHPQPGWAVLDSAHVWEQILETIREAASLAKADPVQALSFSSMGESVVPVSADRRILGPSLLNFDVRGDEYLAELAAGMPDERLYRLNGNALGSPYGLTKLIWVKNNQPQLYDQTKWFLPWAGLAAFLLGGEAFCDQTLANRLLLYDLSTKTWSGELLDWAGLEREKLPPVKPAGSLAGHVSAHGAGLIGLPAGTPIITGGHDQQCNAIGCGVAHSGQAMYGMGSYLCAVPVFTSRPPEHVMLENGLSTEDHFVNGQYVTFIYNQGGVLVKWFRQTFAGMEAEQARRVGDDLYAALLDEMPESPSSVFVLPHFTTTGPPRFLSSSSGVMSGLRLETTRGEILKGIIESATFYIRSILQNLPKDAIPIRQLIAAGGGSQSDAWLQLTADILGYPVTRLANHQAGALGAAILAGAGAGSFSDLAEGAVSMVSQVQTFEPNRLSQRQYDARYERYAELSIKMEEIGQACGTLAGTIA